MLLNREPSPVETYNDVDGEVVNFFRVLREKPEELTRSIGLTPFSREELAIAVSSETGGEASDVEQGPTVLRESAAGPDWPRSDCFSGTLG